MLQRVWWLLIRIPLIWGDEKSGKLLEEYEWIFSKRSLVDLLGLKDYP